MHPPFSILLSAGPSLIRSLIHDILRTHGYKVLAEDCGLSAMVIGHSHPGPIHLLIADFDRGGRGKGAQLAENLAYLRPNLQALYFTEASGKLWLLRNPGALEEIRIPFTPGSFLGWITGILSEAVSARH